MTAQNMYVDPYGTTPVANIRFTPDKDTRIMSFGYEDMFDDSKMAVCPGKVSIQTPDFKLNAGSMDYDLSTDGFDFQNRVKVDL